MVRCENATRWVRPNRMLVVQIADLKYLNFIRSQNFWDVVKYTIQNRAIATAVNINMANNEILPNP